MNLAERPRPKRASTAKGAGVVGEIAARRRAEVDHPVGAPDQRAVVLHHQDGVAAPRQVAEQAEYMAQNFLKYGRPLFNEQAYKLLVNQGQQERADRLLYNKPETVVDMALKGPGASTQGAIDIWNEVFGA